MQTLRETWNTTQFSRFRHPCRHRAAVIYGFPAGTIRYKLGKSLPSSCTVVRKPPQRSLWRCALTRLSRVGVLHRRITGANGGVSP
jgi:hypothetical protein